MALIKSWPVGRYNVRCYKCGHGVPHNKATYHYSAGGYLCKACRDNKPEV